MAETFYVVSKASPDAKDYVSAIAFADTAETIDNEARAHEFAQECNDSRPWQSHEVVSAADYADTYGAEPSETADASDDANATD